MFNTKIGAGNSGKQGFRPETAQGMFKIQLSVSPFQEKLPFGAVQLKGFQK